MTEKLVEVLIMESVAVLMLVLAYLIGIRKKMTLIAGYNERTAHYVTDKEGLARLVARLCLLLGLVSGVMPIATWLWGSTTAGSAFCIGAYAGMIAGTVLLTALQARDFTTTPARGQQR